MPTLADTLRDANAEIATIRRILGHPDHRGRCPAQAEQLVDGALRDLRAARELLEAAGLRAQPLTLSRI